ncbi:hypothetical protein NDU88_001569 [Pleurodeles waltl]|uniref:Claudin n=1 Tax=Pleurodeles waltl TaxID=8319 RepID=A0AAV7TI50_PLEWA|nr:hypothetical protein NDU88_001569 [Pleurodeles waltl]
MVTASVVLGLALAPMGWVLLLAATVTPQWREVPQRPGHPWDVAFFDGLWESCTETSSAPSGRRWQCQPIPEELSVSWLMHLLRSLTVLSLLGSLVSYLLANLGARWWSNTSIPVLTGSAGLGLVVCGVVYLGAVSYMAHLVLLSLVSSQVPERDKFSMGTCLYLGWAGGSAEVLAGIALLLSFRQRHKRTIPRAPETATPCDVDY